MARFKIQDVRALEQAPTSPGTLSTKIGEMIFSSGLLDHLHQCAVLWQVEQNDSLG